MISCQHSGVGEGEGTRTTKCTRKRTLNVYILHSMTYSEKSKETQADSLE